MKTGMKGIMQMLSCLLAAIMIFTLLPVTAMAEETGQTHTHSYGEPVSVDTVNHCRVCTECGESLTELHSFGRWKPQDTQNHVKMCACSATVTEGHVPSKSDDTSCSSCSAAPNEDVHQTVVGDVNTDGAVTQDDAIEAFWISQQSGEVMDPQWMAADVTGDGEVTLEDAMQIYNISTDNQ